MKMAASENNNGHRYHSLQRGLQMLSLVQDSGRMRVSDISKRLEVPLSTVYRYVAALKESGFANEIDGFLVASDRLAEPGIESPHLVQSAAPVLAQMRHETGMSAVLAVRVHISAVCLDVSLAHPSHRVSFKRGHVRNLYAGASALPLLAHAPQKFVKELLSSGLRAHTSATPTTEILAPYLEQIRDEGYAVSHGQITPGMFGVGVPVVVNGSCVCSLSLVGEEVRDNLSLEQILEVLRNGTKRLIERLPTADGEDIWLGEGTYE